MDQFLEVVAQQPSAAMRARLYSAAGLHAGAWLGTFPVTRMTTVRARHWQLAMVVRLGRGSVVLYLSSCRWLE